MQNEPQKHQFEDDGQIDLQQPFRSVCRCGKTLKDTIHSTMQNDTKITVLPGNPIDGMLECIVELRAKLESMKGSE